MHHHDPYDPLISCPNYLWTYRKEMGYSQKTVSRLMGHKSVTPISDYEQGRYIPNLITALKLAIILRRPVSVLYQEHYLALQRTIAEAKKQFPHL